MLMVTSASALAASPSPTTPADRLAAVKARANEAVQKRETRLAKLVDLVNGAANLTAADRAALLKLLQDDEAGLKDLDATVQADTTLDKAREDAAKIVLDYRVFVLVDPKTHEVIASDRAAAADQKLHDLSAKLKAAIDNSKVGDDKKAAARAKLDDFNAQVAAAATSVDGLSAMLLSLQPHGYPANKTQLESGRDRLKTARGHLASARADAKAIRDLLKA
jgi:hypothetical protein